MQDEKNKGCAKEMKDGFLQRKTTYLKGVVLLK